MASPITPSVAPGNYYSQQTVSFGFAPTVNSVISTVGDYPPSLSKYIAYDTLTPPGPFIAVTEDGRGRVLYDGGFPKIYNNRMTGWNGVGTLPTTFAQLIPAHKYFHNVIKWIANPAKAKKVLVLGDRDPSHGANYMVKSTNTNGFNITLSKISSIAGFTTDFKDTADYPNSTLDVTAAELANYAAVIFVGSSDSTAPRITTQAVDNLVAYREAGGGILMITDHGYNLTSINDVNNAGQAFFKSVNMVAARFGAYFTGNFDRTAVNVGFLRSTYGDHPVYNGLLDTDDFSASGSESIIVVTQNPVTQPGNVQPVTTSAVGKNNINMLLNMQDGSIYTEKLVYNVQQQPKPYELIITDAGRNVMNAALANNTPLTGFEIWSRPGVTTITAATTSIPGLARMGIPEFAANMAKTDSTFLIHLSGNLTTFFPRTVAVVVGGLILAAISIDMVYAVDNPNVLPLLMRGIDPKTFVTDTMHAYGDVLSAAGFNAYANALDAMRSQLNPTLYENNILYGQGLTNPPKGESMLVEVDVVTTPLELQVAKSNVVSMQEVFNTWARFSHHTTQGGYSNEANASELLAWQYDAANDLIRCTVNSTTTIGFISPQNVKNYDLDVTMGSTDSDDDLIGLIACAAYVTTANGNELRKLDFYRSPGGASGTGGVRWNAGYPGGTITVNKNTAFKWGNGNYGATAAAAGFNSNTTNADKTGWKYFPAGTRVRIERRNNILTMKASDLDSNVLLPESEVVIDLNSDARYRDFANSARYGFICNSQLDSYWKVNSFTDYDKVIVDAINDKVYVYNGTDWVVDASRTQANIIKPGHFAYSAVNKKLFFRDSDGILIDLTK